MCAFERSGEGAQELLEAGDTLGIVLRCFCLSMVIVKKLLQWKNGVRPVIAEDKTCSLP